MKISQIPEAEKMVLFVILGHVLVHDYDMALIGLLVILLSFPD